jgi:hypothetical protein
VWLHGGTAEHRNIRAQILVKQTLNKNLLGRLVTFQLASPKIVKFLSCFHLVSKAVFKLSELLHQRFPWEVAEVGKGVERGQKPFHSKQSLLLQQRLLQRF